MASSPLTPRAPFNSPMIRTPTPPPASVPMLFEPIERPPHGWLHSSANPEVGVCDGCGGFVDNTVLSTNLGCCSIPCVTKACRFPESPIHNRSSPPLKRQLTTSPAIEEDETREIMCASCSSLVRAITSADGYNCSFTCANTEQDTWDQLVLKKQIKIAESRLVLLKRKLKKE